MSDKQLILLSAILAASSLYLNNVFKIKNLKRRSMWFAAHSNDIFLDSAKIKEYREKLNANLSLEHQDNRILEQIKLFKRDYTNEELLIMKNNFQSLQINYGTGSFFATGEYNHLKNEILLNPLYASSKSAPKYIATLNHELHHMASSLGQIGDYNICGFEQVKMGNKIQHIGRGLNEGYTEYLSKNNLKRENYNYEKNVNLIPLLELFYDDKTELRKSYFNADLPSVIRRLSEVADRKTIIELIKDIDKLFFYDVYGTWFNKSEELELDIRIKLYDLYKKLSGCSNKETLFFEDSMLEKVYIKSKK